MPFRRCLVAGLLGFLPTLISSLVAQELHPQSGVLLLRSGSLLRGEIIRSGDFTQVRVATGTVRVRTADIAHHANSVSAAYTWQRDRIPANHAEAHFDLAEWCLRQGLVHEAAEELKVAAQLEPNHRRLAALQRRSDWVAQQQAHPPNRPGTSVSQPLPPVEPDRPPTGGAATFGPHAVAPFRRRVQPILLNRCGAASCHGGDQAGAFQLARPLTGRPLSRQITLRNLQAVHAQTDTSAPTLSPLLQVPLGPHGGLQIAAWQSTSDPLYRHVENWLAMATRGSVEQAVARAPVVAPQPSVREGQDPPPASTEANTDAAATADPFDPAAFNARASQSN